MQNELWPVWQPFEGEGKGEIGAKEVGHETMPPLLLAPFALLRDQLPASRRLPLSSLIRMLST